jgi:hypothetical protein
MCKERFICIATACEYQRNSETENFALSKFIGRKKVGQEDGECNLVREP